MKASWLFGKLAAGKRPMQIVQRKYPANPDLPTLYAIGDVHGRLDLLAALHGAIDEDWERQGADSGVAAEIYLGDLVDRGPSSAGVIAALLERRARRNCVFIRGNHEAEFLRVLDGSATPAHIVNWFKFGGTATALSYGVTQMPRFSDEDVSGFVADIQARVPASHQQFLADSIPFYKVDPYVFVHAGIRPGLPLELQSSLDLLTIREEFLESTRSHGYIVVHGHTPVMAVQFLDNRINVDTGAFATNRLSCVRLDRTGMALLLSQ